MTRPPSVRAAGPAPGSDPLALLDILDTVPDSISPHPVSPGEILYNEQEYEAACRVEVLRILKPRWAAVQNQIDFPGFRSPASVIADHSQLVPNHQYDAHHECMVLTVDKRPPFPLDLNTCPYLSHTLQDLSRLFSGLRARHFPPRHLNEIDVVSVLKLTR